MAEINPGLLQAAPNIQAPNLLALQAAAKAGLLTDAEIGQLQSAASDRISNLPIQAAQRQSTLRDLAIKPAQQQQALDLGNLQIQEGQEDLKNKIDPTRLIQRKALSDTLGAYYELHPGQAPPTDASGNVDLAAVNQQNIATSQALQAQKDKIAAAKALDEQANKTHLETFGNIPMTADGQVDRKSRDANLAAHGGTAQVIPEKATEQIETLDKVDANIANLEKLFNDRGGSENGFVQLAKGGVSMINPSDSNRKLIDAELVDATQNVGGMFRSNSSASAGGKMQEKMGSMLPGLTDTPSQVKSKLDRLRAEVTQHRQTIVNDLGKSGKNVSRFQTPGSSATPAPSGAGPEVTTQADYDALPKGTVYTWKGKKLTKS